MAIHVLPSLRPVLFGSMLLMSTACRRAERSDAVDTTTPTRDTTSSRSAPAATPPGDPQERIHVTGRDDDPSSFKRQGQEQNREERIHVTGRDDELQLGRDDDELPLGGMGGKTGMGGSGSSH